jgi:hypothetical protein
VFRGVLLAVRVSNCVETSTVRLCRPELGCCTTGKEKLEMSTVFFIKYISLKCNFLQVQLLPVHMTK